MYKIIVSIVSLLASLGLTFGIAAPAYGAQLNAVHASQEPHRHSFHILSLSHEKQAWYLLPAKNRREEYSCLNHIIMHESSWNVHARNPYSGAYGIPQALPGGKMAGWMWYINKNGSRSGKAFMGRNWWGSGYNQLFWMIRKYIPERYGSACSAWSYWQAHNSY